jgi:hypothetical protein
MSSVKAPAWRRQTLCSSALITLCTPFAFMTVPLSMMCAMPLLEAVAILLEEVTKEPTVPCHTTGSVTLPDFSFSVYFFRSICFA